MNRLERFGCTEFCRGEICIKPESFYSEGMLNFVRNLLPERHPLRLQYHKLNAQLASLVYGNPSKAMNVIGITGTAGKTTTCGITHHILQHTGQKCGLISSSHFQVGDQFIPNKTLRTSLRPWHTQRLLWQMKRAGCKHCVVEVSSHALDQHRVLGVVFDGAVLTNIYENEHLDYHGTVADYVKTKQKLFKNLNYSYRKPNLPKMVVVNKDAQYADDFLEVPVDKKWTYSTKKASDYMAENVDYHTSGTSFEVRLPNYHLKIDTGVVGKHNLENLLAAIATAVSCGAPVEKINDVLRIFGGIPGRLETLQEDQPFTVVVDHTYKPSALSAVLQTLKEITPGRVLVVWGGAGGRSPENRIESAQIIHDLADEFILTTDDPYKDSPQKIVEEILQRVEGLKEGDGFFEIEDRYSAISHAVYTAQKDDCVLVAGRGCEQNQCIGETTIEFDDRVVTREILQYARSKKIF